MARLFTGQTSASQTQGPAAALRINSSVQGVAIPILLGGSARLAGNLIDYYGFNSVQQASGGGKGGTTGGGGPKGAARSYQYNVTFVMGLCEGPVRKVDMMWVNGTPDGTIAPGAGTATLPDGTFTDYTVHTGTYTQNVWTNTLETVAAGSAAHGFFGADASVLDLTHEQAYRGTAYIGFISYPLGSSTALPNLNFRVLSNNFGIVPGQLDGYPDTAFSDFLTNVNYGVGFPSARLADLTTWRNYATALGLGVNPVLASPVQASAFANDLLRATNVQACWQDGVLAVVPYGDTAVTAGDINTATETHTVPSGTSYPSLRVSQFVTFAGDGGVAYNGGAALRLVRTYAPPLAVGTYYQADGFYYFSPADANATIKITYQWAATASYLPNTTPLYDFTLDDFLPNQGTIGSGLASQNSPLTIVRKPRDQMINNLKLEYLDRVNHYNPVVIEARDEASIVAFGRERPSDVRQMHLLGLASAAQLSASLQLIREQVARTFQWTCGRHFSLILQLMGIVTVSDPGQNLFRQSVRITEIQENSDFSLTVTAEEFLGTASAPAYGSQATTSFGLDANVDPGSINRPIIFEPTDELGGGLQIWAALSGANPTVWGGCYVWASYDGENYQRVGVQRGAARMGVLSAPLAAVTANATGGQTIDQVNTLSVDITESAGALSSGTQLDATALNTRCYVGGEIIAYATATLTATGKYGLTYLVRGVEGTETEIVNHPVNTPFARLDGMIFDLPFDQSRIGSTLYLKFASFNIYEGGLQSLADVPAYPYVITGAALASPLPIVQNLRTVFDVNTGFQVLDWDDITDFRDFRYEIRVGSSADAALTLGTVAHPPFRVPGDGTYWVAAVAHPVAGLTVYSEAWVDVAISGAVITNNVIKTIDLAALNWPGSFAGGAGVDTGLNAIRTGGGNILTDANILTTSDMLNYGGGSSGTYFPLGAFLDIGYVANASVSIKYQPTGVPVGQNVLAIGDVLSTADMLGSAATRFISVFPQIHTGTTPGGDLYAIGDLYQYPDLYSAAGVNWNGWQSFSPGTYQVRFLDFAMDLQTLDPNTIAYCLAFAVTVTIPARIDQYSLATLNSGPKSITFQPANAASTAPFNGGAGSGNTPLVQGTIRAAQAGDLLVVGSLTTSGCTVEVLNSGSAVVRTVDLTIQGY